MGKAVHLDGTPFVSADDYRLHRVTDDQSLEFPDDKAALSFAVAVDSDYLIGATGLHCFIARLWTRVKRIRDSRGMMDARFGRMQGSWAIDFSSREFCRRLWIIRRGYVPAS